jgi:hypothetical protein
MTHVEWQIRKAIALALIFVGLAMVVTWAWGAHRTDLFPVDKRVPLTLDATTGNPVGVDLTAYHRVSYDAVVDWDDDGVPDYLAVLARANDDDTVSLAVVFPLTSTGELSQTARCTFYAKWVKGELVEWAGDVEWEHHAPPTLLPQARVQP